MEQYQLLANYNDVRLKPVAGAQRHDVAKVAPYLPRNEIGCLIDFEHGKQAVIVGPPIAVQGALNIFMLTRYRQWGNTQLSFGHSDRRLVSYPQGAPSGAIATAYKYADEAQNFASANWGERLAWDTADSKLMCFIISPPHGEVLHRGLAWLDGSFPFVRGLLDEPYSQLIDDAIIRTEHGVVCGSWEPIPVCEMLGRHLPTAVFFCSLCGGGVGEQACNGCGAAFDGNRAKQPATLFPLPRTMARICLQNFAINPVIARLKESELWASKERARLTKPLPPGRCQRVIQLEEDDEDASRKIDVG